MPPRPPRRTCRPRSPPSARGDSSRASRGGAPKKPVRSGSSAAVGSSPKSSDQVRDTPQRYRGRERLRSDDAYGRAAARSCCGSRRETISETPSPPIVTP